MGTARLGQILVLFPGVSRMALGRFITIEGGEGVGKSVFANLLSQNLERMDIAHLRTFEPGGTPTANRLRQAFIHPPKEDPLVIEAEFCVISGARAQHVKRKIIPSLEQGLWIICDRFADSSRIYQGSIGGIGDDILERVITFTCFGIEPDLTFVLDCDVETSMKRIQMRNKDELASNQSRFDQESRDFHTRVRDGFLALKQKFPQRIEVLDANVEPETLAEQAIECIRGRFHV